MLGTSGVNPWGDDRWLVEMPRTCIQNRHHRNQAADGGLWHFAACFLLCCEPNKDKAATLAVPRSGLKWIEWLHWHCLVFAMHHSMTWRMRCHTATDDVWELRVCCHISLRFHIRLRKQPHTFAFVVRRTEPFWLIEDTRSTPKALTATISPRPCPPAGTSCS